MALTEYVIMPGTDYRAACDALREKTGNTGQIRSGELAQQIRRIAGSPQPGGADLVQVSVTNNRTSALTVYYYSAETDGIGELELGRNAGVTLSVPVFSALYLTTKGSYSTSVPPEQRVYLCNCRAVNAHVMKREDEYPQRNRVQYLYDIVAFPYSDGPAEIELTN